MKLMENLMILRLPKMSSRSQPRDWRRQPGIDRSCFVTSLRGSHTHTQSLSLSPTKMHNSQQLDERNPGFKRHRRFLTHGCSLYRHMHEATHTSSFLDF